MALNERQRLFVAEYLVDLNATQAAIRAGYSPRTAKQQGSRLLTNADVQEAVQAAQAQRTQRVTEKVQGIEITADRVLQEVARLAFSDIGQLVSFTPEGIRFRPESEIPEDARRTLSAVEVRQEHGTENRPGATIVKFKLWSKEANLHKLMQHLGLLKEVGSKDNPLTMHVAMNAEEMSDDQLAAIAAGKSASNPGNAG